MNDHTLIALVLDKSGSMQPLQEETISAVNRFVDEQKKVPGVATYTLVQFNTEYSFTHNARPLAEVPPLTAKTYVPMDGTALLDAMGRTIDETGKKLADMPESDRPGKVIVVVMTDGHENSSKEYTRDQVLAKVKRQQEKYGWQFLFLGAGPDAIVQAGALGVKTAGAIVYHASAGGVARAVGSTNEAVSNYRNSGGAEASYTELHRKDNA